MNLTIFCLTVMLWSTHTHTKLNKKHHLTLWYAKWTDKDPFHFWTVATHQLYAGCQHRQHSPIIWKQSADESSSKKFCHKFSQMMIGRTKPYPTWWALVKSRIPQQNWLETDLCGLPETHHMLRVDHWSSWHLLSLVCRHGYNCFHWSVGDWCSSWLMKRIVGRYGTNERVTITQEKHDPILA